MGPIKNKFRGRRIGANSVGHITCITAKSFKDPGCAKEFKKLTGVDPAPITAEAIEAAIRNFRALPKRSRCTSTSPNPLPMPLR